MYLLLIVEFHMATPFGAEAGAAGVRALLLGERLCFGAAAGSAKESRPQARSAPRCLHTVRGVGGRGRSTRGVPRR